MLHNKQGDLLASDCHIIVHQCNCMGVMGAGIARQIKQKYSKAYYADINFSIPVGSRERLGQYSKARHRGKLVINLYSQFTYGSGLQTDYKAMREGLTKLFDTLADEDPGKELKVGMPYLIGAGLAGGDEQVILGILEEISSHYERDIYLYKLT